MITTTHPAMLHLFGQLHEHHNLTSHAGLSSEQASEVVFNRLRTEDAAHDMRSSVSDCCLAPVKFEHINPYCTKCGEFCNVTSNEGI